MTLDTSCQKLDGERTLVLVRARHIEYQSNGRWTWTPRVWKHAKTGYDAS